LFSLTSCSQLCAFRALRIAVGPFPYLDGDFECGVREAATAQPLLKFCPFINMLERLAKKRVVRRAYY
jgi:hypothetical protein